MSKILVFGWYSKNNCGDESYKLSFPQLFADHEVTFTDNLTAAAIEAHDALILGGGNILDLHHVDRVNRFAKQLRGKKPVVAFSVGFTDTQVQACQLDIFDAIYVRDLPELEKLQKLKHKNVQFCPDAAFGMNADVERGKSIWEGYYRSLGRELYDKKVAVVCNSHLTSQMGDGIHRDALRWQIFSTDLATVIDETAASFMMVPFGCAPPWDDRVANSWVGGQCKWFKKNVTVFDNLGVQATLDVLSAADAVVSMRYHATVFSVIAGVPFLDVFHHDKNRGFLKTLGLESWGVPYWDFSRDKAKDILAAHLAGTGEGKDQLHRARQEQKDLLRGGVDGIRFD